MIAIDSLEALAALLEPLVAEGFVRRLDPAPGTRAERWVQLLSPDLHPLDAAPATTAVAPPPSPLAARVEALEVEVARLKEEVERLVAKS
jgi:uncharacterized protein YceH (UPF0502 family)